MTSRVITSGDKKPNRLPFLIAILIILLFILAALVIKNFLVQKPSSAVILSPKPSTGLSPSAAPSNGIAPYLPQDQLEKTYQNTLAGFEIGVPKDWKIDDSGTSRTTVILFDPQSISTKQNAPSTFISISTSRVTNPNLNDYVVSGRKGLTETFVNYILEKDSSLFMNGHNFHLLEGSYTLQNQKIKNKNLLLIFKDRGYAISATAPESIWQEKEALINASLNSFRTL